MSKQLTSRQIDEKQNGLAAYDKYQVFINNHNRIAANNSNKIMLPMPNPLSLGFYAGKLYAGSKNGSVISGAARLKRTAKKRNMAKARASKR